MTPTGPSFLEQQHTRLDVVDDDDEPPNLHLTTHSKRDPEDEAETEVQAQAQARSGSSRAKVPSLHLLCDHDPSPLLRYPTTRPSSSQHSWRPFVGQSWRLMLDSNDNWSIDASSMESLHGVDVSWLHHPHKTASRGNEPRKPPSSTATHEKPNPPANGQKAASHSHPRPNPVSHDHQRDRDSYFPGAVTPTTPLEPLKDTTAAHPSTPSPSTTSAKAASRRPSLLNRNSSEKLNGGGVRRASWITNISSKFSSSGTSGVAPTTSPTTHANGASSPPMNGNGQQLPSVEESERVAPSHPRSGANFFSNLTRKLSAGQSGGAPRAQPKGITCERRVLNVDPNRERCLVPELDSTKLRKVSFCVDVEIAGGPKYRDEEDEEVKKSRMREAKVKERAEGEALKNPKPLKEEKDEKGTPEVEQRSTPLPVPNEKPNAVQEDGSGDAEDASPPVGSVEGVSKKKEKKKRSEEERKERKEKRRRRAEENGSIPVELAIDNEAAAEPTLIPLPAANGAPPGAPGEGVKRDRPTTDPVRIYRRCCQLRETPILKRITEQLMSPNCCVPLEPGVVHCLDLTGSRLQLPDMVTLGDWLAVVPVKTLLLEDADLSDEGLRCILAGLLAATRPQPTKRRSPEPRHRQGLQMQHYQERSGMVEKITLKNNPRITRVGWKHISLFLYMCRSIKAIDISMVRFPETLPASNHASPVKGSSNSYSPSNQDIDAAETLYKCLCQRLGGDKLEELIVSECNLAAFQIRKIVDGAITCGIARLGFAGNNLDDEGLQHVLRYLRSGCCAGLDLGGNNLRDKLILIAEALDATPGAQIWGLSLAGCNLDTASLKQLFPALVKLSNFRFIDLSHNPDLCGRDNGTISLLRHYTGKMKYLKRIHLVNVGMSSKQAIALADVLPEGPRLAHINILGNPQLSALASAKDEASQEEACALYASYMAAVRVSTTLICVDIDVPSADNSEVVKALAKQVVAYSLRNMERFAIAEATGAMAASDAAASLTQPHGDGKQLEEMHHVKEIAVPDVLMHLVGNEIGDPDDPDNEPAPDGDYIVGGTGVVKALQYVLGEKADDLRRDSVPSGTRSSSRRPVSSASLIGEEEQRGKAKKMSKNLLEGARKIRARIQPALAREASGDDDMAYRRLCFLDQTLESMIQRFEEEYPETRLPPPSPLALSSASSGDLATLPSIKVDHISKSDGEDDLDDYDPFRPPVSRHSSDVSLASRALVIEEGHLHRLGQQMRRDVVDSPATSPATETESAAAPWSKEEEAARLRALQVKVESISGLELKSLVEHDGWDSALRKVGANMNDLMILQSQDPKGWEEFKESQMKARWNAAQGSEGA